MIPQRPWVMIKAKGLAPRRVMEMGYTHRDFLNPETVVNTPDTSWKSRVITRDPWKLKQQRDQLENTTGDAEERERWWWGGTCKIPETKLIYGCSRLPSQLASCRPPSAPSIGTLLTHHNLMGLSYKTQDNQGFPFLGQGLDSLIGIIGYNLPPQSAILSPKANPPIQEERHAHAVRLNAVIPPDWNIRWLDVTICKERFFSSSPPPFPIRYN